MKWKNWFFLTCSLLALGLALGLRKDPYEILGVKRSAASQEIRKAFKHLAKEWHPDKNSNPEAENKFVEITEAYELLMDPERRKKFDSFGITEDAPAFTNKPDYSQYRRFDPLDDLFGFQGSSFRFHYQDRDITIFHKLSVTTKAYENHLVPKSYRTPYLILFYSDWCFACLQMEPIWRRIMEELEPIGVGVATVHSENEPLLVKKVGVSSLPLMVLLMDGKAMHYKESLFSVQKVVEFVRSKFPYKLVQPVNDENIEMFLNSWTDNRVRILICENHDSVRLRYILMAYYYRDRVAFGFVQVKSLHAKEVVQRFKVPLDKDTLLLFNENTERPVASLSMPDIPVKTMHDIISNNKYLLLPRLSSQAMFDALCPPDSARPRKRLCVILVSQNTPYHDEPRQVLRQFAQETSYSTERVRFMYIFKERQTDFISALTSGQNSPPEPTLHVVIIWRCDSKRIKYDWLPEDWGNSEQPQWNATRERLSTTIQRLLQSADALSYEAIVQELIDEHAQGMVGRILNKIFVASEYLRDNVTKEQLLPALSVVGTVLFIVVAGYFMAYLVRLEEEKIAKSSSNGMSGGKLNNTQQQLKLHELRPETYNGMVRLLKPGCRTIVLLVDQESRKELLIKFHKTVWPYRKNKTLMFGYLNLEKGLEWYKRLLMLSLPEPRDLNINPKNCIGTVISLNGHRKYFCMYHAKHPESMKGKGSKRMAKMTKRISNYEAGTNGAFMGFETSESEDTENSDLEQGPPVKNGVNSDRYSNVVFKENLLDGLANWLDRLFEGSTYRYYINYWPDFPN
ncbi:dnaJ homolog subfamily C member 16 isoform X2 [Cloeon dipterum]|uniref:dnaJ homolog subfamily C member 16 isoform X2 n=1 Tax=Cloeon dipterum TaxID=197152 RepID=UPI003220750A